MTRSRRIALIALAAVAVLALGVVLAWSSLVVAAVKWEASRRGFELQADSADGGFDKVELRGVRVTLRGTRVTATAASAKVYLSLFSAKRVDVEGAIVALDDADLGALLAHDGGGDVTWYLRKGEIRAGVTRFVGVDVDLAAAGGRASAAELSAAGRSIRGLSATWTRAGATTTFDVPGTARGTLRRTGGDTRADVEIVPAPLAKLSPDFPPAARLSGTVGVTVDAKGGLSGEATLVLDAWTPPVAREAASFVGARTQLQTKLASRDGGPIELRELKVQNGSLALAGTGTLSRQGALRASLDGSVPCSRVAGQAAKAALGDLLGGIAGAAAGAAISGSIGVHLDVSADARQPAASRVTPSVRVACGF